MAQHRTFWSKLMAGLAAGLSAFREVNVVGKHIDPDDYQDPNGRRLRYALLWAFYENTTYREVHSFASMFKARYGLYRYTRNIYNPAYRLGEFWKTHLWGGALDLEAGDGKEQPSALPIITDNEKLRPAIARLWQWSNWFTRKDIATLYGATMGDVAIKVVDDAEREKCYMQVVHPMTLWDVEVDPFGNVKSYQIKETRTHPENPNQECTYLETAKHGEGDEIIYTTDLDGKPYAWNGEQAEWSEPYGFIPLVVVQHNDVGLGWGWAEIFPGLSKVRELDDLASMLSDQIRKAINPIWLFKGAKPSASLTLSATADTVTGTDARPEAGREDVPALYGGPDADAKPLVYNLDIKGSLEHLTGVLEQLERDYPELRYEELRLAGQVSGQALRVARQPAEAKVIQRRGVYDDALVRAQQMGVAIGGLRNYDGFAGFNLDSYAGGKLEHGVGSRTVFAVDPLDAIEEKKQFWQMVEQAEKAGATLDGILRLEGWDEERIATLLKSPEYQARQAARGAALQNLGMMGEGEEEEEKEEIR